jgi:hypothetical protein
MTARSKEAELNPRQRASILCTSILESPEAFDLLTRNGKHLGREVDPDHPVVRVLLCDHDRLCPCAATEVEDGEFLIRDLSCNEAARVFSRPEIKKEFDEVIETGEAPEFPGHGALVRLHDLPSLMPPLL